MRKPIIGIYLLTSPSGKYYVGQSKDILSRWNKYKCKQGTNNHFQKALDKYGPENFVYSILETTDDISLLNSLEKKWISFYEATNPNKGYNKTFGGDRPAMTDATKQRMREAHLGKKLSEETKKKLLGRGKNYIKTEADLKGIEKRKQSMKGKKLRPRTEEEKNNLREKQLGRKHSEETKKKMSIAHLGKKAKDSSKLAKILYERNRKNCRKVLCIENNKTYATTGDAERELGISNVLKVCNGSISHSKGYHFCWI